MMVRNLLIAGISCCALGLAVVLFWPADSSTDESVPRATTDSVSAPTAPAVVTGNTTDVSLPTTEDRVDSATSEDTYGSVMDAADTLMQCTLDGSCIADDQSDPRAGHMESVEKLSQTLDALVEAARNDNAAPEPRLGSFARRMLAFPDGHVQARAISLMGTIDPQPQNVDAIVTHLAGHHDAALFELGLAELGRYAGTSGSISEQIDGFLARTLRSGGHFAAQTVATNVGKLIHAGNLERFEALAAELPAQTRTARLLKSTLAEYRIVASGG